MTIQFDVKSAQLGVGESVPGRVRLKGILISAEYGSSLPVIEIKNGSSSGSAVFGFNPIASGNVYVAIPGDGILCENGIYMNRSDAAAVTVFYG